MKIIVVSDSHGHTDRLERVIETSLPFDMLIHCGDGIKDIGAVKIPENAVVAAVRGNTDIHSCYESEEFIIENIMGMKVAVTHGHRFNVKAGISYLVSEAEKFGVSVVIFGHTHTRLITAGHPLLFNPGALSENSYGVIEAKESGRWSYEHRMLTK